MDRPPDKGQGTIVTMHWVELGGVRLPRRISGDSALDFCNTWAGWGEPPAPEREWLSDYDRFALWAQYADLVDASTSARLRDLARARSGDAAEVLVAARSLRAQLHAAVLDPADAEALAAVSVFARQAAACSVLRPGADGRPQWEVTADAKLTAPLHAVARAAADFLTSGDLELVKACPGPDCGWLFVDRRGRRRWCSMSTCGNRAKVRAHAERNH
jgi:predicted RNA-binding Zn ribbon-like protein